VKNSLVACALSAWIAASHAQGGAPVPGATPTPVPPAQSPGTTSAPSQPSPQRGAFIAPIVDIRIQGEGIALPKGVGEPQPEKPPAR
jgi:hypothetical protein